MSAKRKASSRKKTKIDGTKLTLDDWLAIVLSPRCDDCYPNHRFPTDEMRDEYLDSIESRSEKDVIDLLRCFLIPTSWPDELRLQTMALMRDYLPEKFQRTIENEEFTRRILRGEPAWEGTTWVIDLLDRSPSKALSVLWAYFLAQMWHFSDEQNLAHDDSLRLIRAKFVDMSHPQQIFMDLSPREFEVLIKGLYREMGYKAELTPPRNDGGRDIIAYSRKKGRREKIFVECKRWKNNVGRPVLNKLFGVVQAQHYSRGVLVCCSDFTRPARQFAAPLPTLELINLKDLCQLLNQHLGPRWKVNIDQYLKAEEEMKFDFEDFWL